MPLKLARRKGSPFWYLRGTVRGIAVYESAATIDRRQAEACRAKREAELYEESVFGPRAVISLDRAAVSYLDFEPRSPATIAYVERLRAYFGMTRLGTIDQNAVERAVTEIVGADAAPATKRRAVYGPLTAILNHGASRGWCGRPKFEQPTVPRGNTRWLTPREVDLLMAAAAPHLRTLLLFLVCTGARLSEALDLTWEDVDLPAAMAVFRNTKNRHSPQGGTRAASLPPAVIAALASLEDTDPECHTKTGAVFRCDDGKPYTDRQRLEGGQIKTGWRTACRRAGLVMWEETDGKLPDADGSHSVVGWRPSATPHDLRHTWATWFYALTKDTLLLKTEGGWLEGRMVERYAHLMPSILVPEIAVIWGPSHPRIGPLPCAFSAHPGQAPAKIA